MKKCSLVKLLMTGKVSNGILTHDLPDASRIFIGEFRFPFWVISIRECFFIWNTCRPPPTPPPPKKKERKNLSCSRKKVRQDIDCLFPHFVVYCIINIFFISDAGSSFKTFGNLCQLSECQGVAGKINNCWLHNIYTVFFDKCNGNTYQY